MAPSSIAAKVDEFAGTALNYVVVFREASVHRGATQSCCLPVIRAFGLGDILRLNAVTLLHCAIKKYMRFRTGIVL
jgi:hypothetical protein